MNGLFNTFMYIIKFIIRCYTICQPLLKYKTTHTHIYVDLFLFYLILILII